MAEPVKTILKQIEDNKEHMLELAKKVFEPLKYIFYYKKKTGTLWWTKYTQETLIITYSFEGLNEVSVRLLFEREKISGFYCDWAFSHTFTENDLNQILIGDVSMLDERLRKCVNEIYFVSRHYRKLSDWDN